MLRSVKNLHFSPVFGLDGIIGDIDRFYFQEKGWSIVYFVVTGKERFTGKTVLLPVDLYQSFDWQSHELFVQVNDEQISHSPEIPDRLPEIKASELQLEKRFGWGRETLHIGKINRQELSGKKTISWNSGGDLTSTKMVLGLMLKAEDKRIGIIDDMAVDETTWEIRFLISHPFDHIAPRRMIVYPNWIKQISWARKKIELFKNSNELVTSYLV
jgi:hypothetical protein